MQLRRSGRRAVITNTPAPALSWSPRCPAPQNKDLEKGAEYRQLLVGAIHQCAVRFPDVAASVLHLLMDFLSDTNTASALDVVFFIREIIQVGIFRQRFHPGRWCVACERGPLPWDCLPARGPGTVGWLPFHWTLVGLDECCDRLPFS